MFEIGQRVVSTFDPSLRQEEAELNAFFGASDDEITCVLNQPIEGDLGTVVSVLTDEDGKATEVLVRWDREIGPITGKRTSTYHWFVPPYEVEPHKADPELAQAA